MTAGGGAVGAPPGCADLCVSCGSAVKTLANVQVVGDEKHLAPTWMPPGGCTCHGIMLADADPNCLRCFPSELLCQKCGESRIRPAKDGTP